MLVLYCAYLHKYKLCTQDWTTNVFSIQDLSRPGCNQSAIRPRWKVSASNSEQQCLVERALGFGRRGGRSLSHAPAVCHCLALAAAAARGTRPAPSRRPCRAETRIY